MWKAIVAISLGSAIGGLLRWGLSLKLNALLIDLPPGTLLSNLIAGFVIGIGIAWLAQAPGLPPEWRLFLITGFCGGLSTFSTFSAEVVALLQRGQLGWAAAEVGVHVVGSVLATLAGMGVFTWLKGQA